MIASLVIKALTLTKRLSVVTKSTRTETVSLAETIAASEVISVAPAKTDGSSKSKSPPSLEKSHEMDVHGPRDAGTSKIQYGEPLLYSPLRVGTSVKASEEVSLEVLEDEVDSSEAGVVREAGSVDSTLDPPRDSETGEEADS